MGVRRRDDRGLQVRVGRMRRLFHKTGARQPFYLLRLSDGKGQDQRASRATAAGWLTLSFQTDDLAIISPRRHWHGNARRVSWRARVAAPHRFLQGYVD